MYEYKFRKTGYSILFVVLIVIDQALKYLIRTSGGFYICNQNLAFGLSPLEMLPVFLGFIIAMLVFNFKFQILNFKSISNFKFSRLCGTPPRRWQISNSDALIFFSVLLILSGAISNVIDRLSFGCVIDFIEVGFWPVFNLADVYITIGGIMIIRRLFEKNNSDKCKMQISK